jgi:hypothetical protein
LFVVANEGGVGVVEVGGDEDKAELEEGVIEGGVAVGGRTWEYIGGWGCGSEG